MGLWGKKNNDPSQRSFTVESGSFALMANRISDLPHGLLTLKVIRPDHNDAWNKRPEGHCLYIDFSQQERPEPYIFNGTSWDLQPDISPAQEPLSALIALIPSTFEPWQVSEILEEYGKLVHYDRGILYILVTQTSDKYIANQVINTLKQLGTINPTVRIEKDANTILIFARFPIDPNKIHRRPTNLRKEKKKDPYFRKRWRAGLVLKRIEELENQGWRVDSASDIIQWLESTTTALTTITAEKEGFGFTVSQICGCQIIRNNKGIETAYPCRQTHQEIPHNYLPSYYLYAKYPLLHHIPSCRDCGIRENMHISYEVISMPRLGKMATIQAKLYCIEHGLLEVGDPLKVFKFQIRDDSPDEITAKIRDGTL